MNAHQPQEMGDPGPSHLGTGDGPTSVLPAFEEVSQ